MPNTTDVVLLCGGAGLRLRSVLGNAPKGMADLAGRPFLELLLRQLRRHGFERVILAVGYQNDMICSHFGERACGLDLAYSTESFPLGTGGALRNAADLIESENVLIMNGDSYTNADLGEFVVDHRQAKADLSIIVVPADGRGDCGSIAMDGSRKLTSFAEKQDPFHAQYVNAGIYMISRHLLCEIPSGFKVSLEREVLPQWLRQGKYIKGFVCLGKCIDIGTPERYRTAQDILATAETDASARQRENHL